MQRINTLFFSFLIAVALTACGGGGTELPNGPVSGSATSETSSSDLTESTVAVKRDKWRPVSNFTGKASQRTKPFSVSGTEWKVNWRSLEGKGEFNLVLYNADNNEQVDILISTTLSDEDTEYFTQPGRYYFEVKSDRPYEIAVEEYK